MFSVASRILSWTVFLGSRTTRAVGYTLGVTHEPGPAPTALETISRIREILETSRDQALTAVNTARVRAYWLIGREITEEELRGADRAGYGMRLLNTLAERLSLEFGKGFDRSNLTNMRGFYLAFPILDALRQELSWTHYRCMMLKGLRVAAELNT
jgi:DUF1016 N-terminal domain